ncbi:acyl carrier protein [Streptomyces sp. MK5]|uniref:acyl carrier protein n=1 Tax=Streptomyces sp. MK5 TaxID=3064253 RepID=UPI002741AAC6|nr:phosphopantetheine-binding protein [Streptomyces sp. MK5]
MSADRIVLEVVEQLLDFEPGKLTVGTALTEIEGWDSVNQMRVLVYLERELASSLDYDRFMKAESLADVSALVAETGADGGQA